MEFRCCLLVALVVTGLIGSVVPGSAYPSAVSADDTAPFAEAGLDQDSPVGQRVFLDGGGSHAPSGEITEYDWTIEVPNGSTVSPDCAECVRTAFVPDQEGRYAVSLQVTTEDGRTDTDTMYVTAANTTVPDVTVTGPDSVETGASASFSAAVEPGDAELTRVDWTVDGETVDRTPLNGVQTVSTNRTFETSGAATVSATVRDAAGRTRSDSRRVRVTGGGAQQSDTGPSLAFTGQRVVTGEEPLAADYSVAGADASSVDSVTWYDETGRVGSGDQLSKEWEPGVHELFAVGHTDDDSHRITFENGSRVVADPRPNVSMTAEQDAGILSGSVDAGDEFGNLRTVSLFVDDERVREWSPENGSSYETSFTVDLNADQAETRVRAVATDEREQAATESSDAGDPELVRAGFVNGPVDSYHEWIDPERYTATHEIVVDMNGADVNRVSPQLFRPGPDNNLKLLQGFERDYNPSNDLLTIQSMWAGERPGEYSLPIISGGAVEAPESILQVTSSPPEVRLEVLDEGEDAHGRAHLLLVDVSDTFDPDGSRLDFYVQDRDRYEGDPDLIGIEFSHQPGLTISDRYDNSVDISSELYDYWSPGISKVTELSEGPYELGDTVEFRVETEEYQLSDPSYRPSIKLQIDYGTGSVTEWEKKKIDPGEGPDSDPHDGNHRKYVGTVEIDASSFEETPEPSLTVYNSGQNSQSAKTESLPDVTVVRENLLKRLDVEVVDLRYVESPTRLEKSADSYAERRQLVADGYSAEDETKKLESITIEKRETTREQVTKTEAFSSKTSREAFVSSRVHWAPAGTKQRTVSRTETVWRDSPTVGGGYTGQTRLVMNCESGAELQLGRCVPADSVVWEMEYLHKIGHEEKETMYLAEKRLMETETEWTHYREFEDTRHAYQYTSIGDFRIGERTYSTTWEMTKFVDRTTISESYDVASNVDETRATVKGDIGYNHRRIQYTGEPNTVVKEGFREQFTFDGVQTREEIVKSVENGRERRSQRCLDKGQVGC